MNWLWFLAGGVAMLVLVGVLLRLAFAKPKELPERPDRMPFKR